MSGCQLFDCGSRGIATNMALKHLPVSYPGGTDSQQLEEELGRSLFGIPSSKWKCDAIEAFSDAWQDHEFQETVNLWLKEDRDISRALASVVNEGAASRSEAQVANEGAASRSEAQVANEGAASRSKAQVANEGAASRSEAQVANEGAASRSKAQVANEGAASRSEAQVANEGAASRSKAQVANEGAASRSEAQVTNEGAASRSKAQVADEVAAPRSDAQVCDDSVASKSRAMIAKEGHTFNTRAGLELSGSSHAVSGLTLRFLCLARCCQLPDPLHVGVVKASSPGTRADESQPCNVSVPESTVAKVDEGPVDEECPILSCHGSKRRSGSQSYQGWALAV